MGDEGGQGKTDCERTDEGGRTDRGGGGEMKGGGGEMEGAGQAMGGGETEGGGEGRRCFAETQWVAAGLLMATARG